jgi:hypothetical protein
MQTLCQLTGFNQRVLYVVPSLAIAKHFVTAVTPIVCQACCMAAATKPIVPTGAKESSVGPAPLITKP